MQEVDEIIPTSDVGQFVEQDHFDFIGTPAGEGGGREQDHWPEDADEDGGGDALADGHGDAARDVQRGGESREEVGDRAIFHGATRAAKAAGADDAGE